MAAIDVGPTEPTLVRNMREWSTGEVQHIPAAPIGMGATRTVIFLNQLDAWATAIKADAWDVGYEAGKDYRRFPKPNPYRASADEKPDGAL